MTASDESGWLSRRQRDGGIDQIPTPVGVAGPEVGAQADLVRAVAALTERFP
ncbi:MAG TPA: hypothetical protein VMM60_04150 [Ilumatobacter sp.]|nr:hypothetical protein [Ilumatobacter sp.]